MYYAAIIYNDTKHCRPLSGELGAVLECKPDFTAIRMEGLRVHHSLRMCVGRPFRWIGFDHKDTRATRQATYVWLHTNFNLPTSNFLLKTWRENIRMLFE